MRSEFEIPTRHCVQRHLWTESGTRVIFLKRTKNVVRREMLNEGSVTVTRGVTCSNALAGSAAPDVGDMRKKIIATVS